MATFPYPAQLEFTERAAFEARFRVLDESLVELIPENFFYNTSHRRKLRWRDEYLLRLASLALERAQGEGMQRLLPSDDL
jgi:hypothetical protein